VDDRVYNVLFLCTGNSARSIMAEAFLNGSGKEHFRAYSAGSHPRDAVHPLALQMIAEEGLPSEGLRSKSWDEFAAPGAPQMDFVLRSATAPRARPALFGRANPSPPTGASKIPLQSKAPPSIRNARSSSRLDTSKTESALS
jgi:hypothetical protein